MHITHHSDLASSLYFCSAASAMSEALQKAKDAQLETVHDEDSHERFSESTFEIAHVRLTELLQDTEVRHEFLC